MAQKRPETIVNRKGAVSINKRLLTFKLDYYTLEKRIIPHKIPGLLLPFVMLNE